VGNFIVPVEVLDAATKKVLVAVSAESESMAQTVATSLKKVHPDTIVRYRVRGNPGSDASSWLIVLEPISLRLPLEGQVVMTNLGEAFHKGGIWFKWWTEIQRGSRVAIRDQSRITHWEKIQPDTVASH